MRRLLVAVIVFVACSRAHLPVNTLLWRLGEWRSAGSVRTAPAVIISFRKSGEYIEHYCRVIEQPDQTVYISSSDPHVIAIGDWKKSGSQMIATRNLISRPGGSLCGAVAFDVTGNSVVSKEGQFSPVTRLVSPDFEVYVNDARRSATRCASS